MRKGRYPGGPKAGIYSEQVWNGGASDARVRELWKEEQREKREMEEAREMGVKRSKTTSKRSSGGIDVTRHGGSVRRERDDGVGGVMRSGTKRRSERY